MFVIGKVSQHSLHRRPLELMDRVIERASLFPLIDQSGRTQALMLTSDDLASVYLIDWNPAVFEHRRFRPNRLQVRFADLRDSEISRATSLERLWHFDPWWLLGELRFAGHEAVPPLKRSNIPGYDREVQHAWFDKGLERMTHLGSGTGESYAIRRVDTRTLDDLARLRRARTAPVVLSVVRTRVEWRLRPFWE